MQPAPAHSTLPFALHRDAWGKLCLTTADGAVASGVFAVRMFPLSDSRRWVSICDARGRELAWVENLEDLPESTRAVLEDELAQRDFLPVISRVHGVSSLSEPCEWDVETDRGRARFILKSEDDVHRLGPYRALIIDARGLRFLVRDSRELDAASRRCVEWYL